MRIDGRLAGPGTAGEDVRGGAVTVTGQRLYHLVALPGVREVRLRLEFPPGVTGYAFTFG